MYERPAVAAKALKTLQEYLCTVAAPHGELRLRLARHPGLVPALLHLASATRPVPRLYPEDSTPLYASACLRQLLFAPVVIGDPAAAAPEAPAAPWPPAAASPRGGRLRLVAAGHEGHGAELAAARGAQAAFLAAPGEPVAVLAGALEWIILEEDLHERSAWFGAASMCCLHSADGPEPGSLENAVEARAEQTRELAACLADLCVFEEHARAVLPHAPLLRRLFAVCVGADSDPIFGGYDGEFDPDFGGVPHYNWKHVRDGAVPLVFTNALLHSLFTAHARLRGHFPAECPPLEAGLAALAARQAENLKAIASPGL
eukprot:tig00020964_g16774.t1